MEPVSSNNLSNTCSNIMGSSCVAWNGGAISGVPLCPGASLTDVILGISQNCCASNSINPCAANGWQNLTSNIPGSLTGDNCSYILSGTQNFYGEAPFPAIVNDPPGYRWTKDGNIKLRGVFDIDFTATGQIGYISIPLGSVSTSCFSVAPTNSQVVLTEADRRLTGNQTNFLKAYAVLAPSGALSVLVTFDFHVPFYSKYSISLGGVEFNL